ncbi:MAG: penicillin-binding protein 2 [Campylobacterota bacterium]|nr:penicillin-binding protein 2 [Campylobacterota bacterium]
MKTNKNNQQKPMKRNIKLWYLVSTILFFITMMTLYLVNIYDITNDDIKLPSKNYGKKDIAVRGSILTADSFKVAKSVQAYKVIIDTRFLDKNKQDLFITLFSIYTNIDKQTLRDKINNQKRKGRLVLTYNIDSKTAANLNQLKPKLINLKVFIPLVKKSSFIIGMDISISGDKRIYPYEKSLTPLTGYIKKYETKKDLTRLKGVKGVERFYNKELNDITNGLRVGSRDLVGDIIFNKDSEITRKVNGKSIKLNIPLKLQQNIEYMIDLYKTKFQAKEIIVSVMDSTTGKILSLATSNRYNPKKIKQDEVGYLNLSAIEHQFEPGSIIKPIAMALAFDKDRVKLNELIDAFNKGKRNKKGLYPRGKYKIGKHRIGDDHRFKKRYITPTDTIVYSSNIGILQIAQRLSGVEFKDGFERFGLSKKTNIDLPYEKKGVIHSLKQYQAYETKKDRDNIYKATDSYGQGITSTFIQVLKAYSVFNNNGYIVTPQVVFKIINTSDNDIKKLQTKEQIKIIKQQTAMIIKDMLIKTVQIGTGVATKIEGLEIGGKTGTSQIARKGKYQREYISSFFGFANDRDFKYTIGVTVFEPSWKYHYASQSATPVFKKTIEILVKQGYLKKDKYQLNR